MRRADTIASLTSQPILSVLRLTSSSLSLRPILWPPKKLPGQSLSLWRLVATLASVQRDKSLSPTAAALIRASLADYGRSLRKVKGSAADVAQARDLAAILLDSDPARLNALADALKSAPRLPPGPPIGEDDWFGGLGL